MNGSVNESVSAWPVDAVMPEGFEPSDEFLLVARDVGYSKSEVEEFKSGDVSEEQYYTVELAAQALSHMADKYGCAFSASDAYLEGRNEAGGAASHTTVVSPDSGPLAGANYKARCTWDGAGSITWEEDMYPFWVADEYGEYVASLLEQAVASAPVALGVYAEPSSQAGYFGDEFTPSTEISQAASSIFGVLYIVAGPLDDADEGAFEEAVSDVLSAARETGLRMYYVAACSTWPIGDPPDAELGMRILEDDLVSKGDPVCKWRTEGPLADYQDMGV